MNARQWIVAAAAALGGCGDEAEVGSSTARVELVLVLEDGTAVREGGRLVVQSGAGQRVELDRAYVVSAALELRPCDAGSRWHGFSVFPSAYAHMTSSPTLFGLTVVEDLVASTTYGDYGTLQPPVGRYCGLKWWQTGADTDAVGLPAEPDLIGQIVHVAGTWFDDEGSGTAFEFAAEAAYDVTDALEGGVELRGDDVASYRLTATRRIDALFAGLDMAAIDGIDVAIAFANGATLSLVEIE